MAKLLRGIYRQSTGEYLDNEQSWVKGMVVGDGLLAQATKKWGEDIEIREAERLYLKFVKDGKLVDDQVKIAAIAAEKAKPPPPTPEERILALEAAVAALKTGKGAML